ncbi:PEP-CTERM sorting domain-containing protein [Synoicihabitans lomoniglobus]|uniref:PEP-CTERM sorting domain-containing protein n=1 Tax=Synoicihabitans lomoniglobus TaxID=2909285 RepID=A0AAE9ZUB2_9BACT|nr:PEP-CTERM sorting domain-containing protein [Opitutaceae bacterium LMO-M01]WED65295.1 PEP-CTERM sorting domain-containing protein [Opitutaceae bacterium LMO-M01]
MMISRPLFRSLITVSLTTSAIHAQVLFNQDFTSSTDFEDYFSESPSAGQFNDINTGASNVATISNGTLTFTKSVAGSGGSSGFVRTTDIGLNPNVLQFSFTFNVSGNSSDQTSGTQLVLQVGAGFGTGVTAESNSEVHSRIAFNWTEIGGQWAIEPGGGGSASSNYIGAQTVTWVVNNSGSSFDYTAPNSSTTSVANDSYDLWIGDTLELTSVTATSASQSLTDFKFAFNTAANAATISFDNLSISSLSAVPEPSSFATLAGFAVLGLAASRRRRSCSASLAA